MFRDIANLEDARGDALIGQLKNEADSQLRYELAAPVAVIVMIALLLPVARRRVIRPLEAFGRQVTDLAQGDFTPAPEETVDSLTLPLHKNFLKLAIRLQELEQEHKLREASLEEEVRAATRTLLEQQRSLASAERLAATGELAASVAHELRNPLAAIQMSLTNMCRELDEPDVVERLRLVVGEVERIARLVTGLVDEARHAPENSSVVDVGELVNELLALTRYQMPEGITVDARIEDGLRCRLPQQRLRQALLNLILNSSNAIGDNAGTIELEMRSRGSDLEIRLLDDGPGFPPEMLESGIRPFYSTRAAGTGLGLAMVRRFTREAEGTIELSNRQDRQDRQDRQSHHEGRERPGACVTLLLPSVVEHG